MPAGIPERFIWATGLLDIQPGDSILEIGCGAGIWAEQMAARLRGGMLTAMDRSSAMVQKAVKRNRDTIGQGKVELFTAVFSDWKAERKYDKIVSFNVNIFWKGSGKELYKIHDLLRPAGQVYCFYEAPFEGKIQELINLISVHLEGHAFSIRQARVQQLMHRDCCCITAVKA